MRGGRFGVLILAAFAASPAVSAPTTPERPSAEIARDPNAVLDSDLRGYGEWLGQIDEIETPVQQQMTGLQAVWRRSMNSTMREGIPLIRNYISSALAVIDAADARIAAITVPDFPHLSLGEDLLPSAIVLQIRQFNRQIRAVVASYLPLLDSFTRPQETEAAATRLLANLRLVFESQLVLLRAGQASTPRDYVAWDIAGLQIGFVRAGARIFSAYDPLHPQVDAHLPADLIAIADELDACVLRVDQKLTASLGRLDNAIAEAERLADVNRVAVLRRSRAVIALNRDYIPVARQLSTSLQQAAAAVRGRPLTSDLLMRTFAPLGAVRAGFDDVIQRQNQAMADGP